MHVFLQASGRSVSSQVTEVADEASFVAKSGVEVILVKQHLDLYCGEDCHSRKLLMGEADSFLPKTTRAIVLRVKYWEDIKSKCYT
jgi:hypothetical protein